MTSKTILAFAAAVAFASCGHNDTLVKTTTQSPQTDYAATLIANNIKAAPKGYSISIGIAKKQSAGTTTVCRDVEKALEKLEADGRFAPILTADGTEYRKPSRRAELAKAAGAELLLSIHLNYDADSSVAGEERAARLCPRARGCHGRGAEAMSCRGNSSRLWRSRRRMDCLP